jgi:N6-L-threonylcarbamoyladenine synthase
MVNRPGLDFSFSGLKTYTLNTVKDCRGDGELSERDRCDIARAFEEAVVSTLVIKCRRALAQENLKTLIIAGGVSANVNLRQALETALAKEGARVYYAKPAFCTDNGAMIAYAGAQRLQAGQVDTPETAVRPRWPMEELPPLVDAGAGAG